MKKYFVTTMICLVLIASVAYGAIIHVPGEQPTIQAGIDAASDGDTVLVADGTYTGDGNRDIDFKRKAITVKSENGAGNCIIDCQGTWVDPHRGFYFHSGETETSVVDGFTIKNGWVDDCGGGIYCISYSSPTITNTIITGNYANYRGGGIYCISSSSPTITNATITGNSAGDGGGIYCSNHSSPTITNTIITGNSANYYSGGIYCYMSSPTITNTTITGNSASYSGGICCDDSSPTITNTTITGNSANDGGGGGIFCYKSSPTITNTTITGNSANGYGGGIFCYNSFPTITNTTITGNSASEGGGIGCQYYSSPTLINCILWNDNPQEIYFDSSNPNGIEVSYSDVQGGKEGIVHSHPDDVIIWGEGNIDADPLFVDPDNGDYHLNDYSPCIGAGIMAPDVPDKDLEGNPRPNPPDSAPDIGAYENPLGEPILEPPTVTDVTPSSRGQGARGQNIVVTGENFMSGAVVSFSGIGITVNSTTFKSSTELVANIDIASDAPVGVRDVIVTNPDSRIGVGEDMFTVNPAPTVTGATPSSLPQGSENRDVTIVGANFVDGPQLTADFRGGITVNSVTFVSPTQLNVNITIADDAVVGARDVTVINGDAGVGIGVGIFTVTYPPIIERISPEIGQISGGDEVTITGNYFQDGAAVTIGGNPAEVVSVSETQITAKIPKGELGITDVVVTNPDGGSATLLRGFAYIPVYGDVSGNGTVSAYDAALILKFTVGLISEFPVQQLLSPEQNITPRNYIVSIPELPAKAGSKIQVLIVIDDATGLFAGGISISYDASVLKAVNALPTEMLNGSYWKANVSFPGEVRFAFAKTELMQGNGSLLTIEFQVLPDAEGKSSPLSFSSINLSNSLSVGKIDGLVNVLPAKTALLPNYPNPFNPETWIPYKLSQDASVAIYIYSSNGQLVRKLSLGHQSAGVYVSKAQAARWDGKDSLGQKVASGVYYYTLQVREAIPNIGDREFTATRKMVVLK